MAEIKIPTKIVVGVILIACVGLFILGWYVGSTKARKPLKSQIMTLNGQISNYVVKLAEKELYISEVEQEIATKDELIRRGEIERKELKALNLKKVNEISRLKLKINTLLTDISHNGQIIQVPSQTDSVSNDTITVKKNALLLPFDFAFKDKWTDLSGLFNSQGKLDISFGLDFEADLWAGIDRATKKNIALLTTDCPYIKTVSFKSIKLDLPKKKYYGIGLNVGYGISLSKRQVVATPYVGFGVSYNFIRF